MSFETMHNYVYKMDKDRKKHEKMEIVNLLVQWDVWVVPDFPPPILVFLIVVAFNHNQRKSLLKE